MSSTPLPADDTTLADDRTTKARIRDAAIACFAENGIADTTVRKVAESAGVSPGSVIHHFGSMEGLRAGCDEYVAATIRGYKRDAMTSGPSIDVLAALRDTSMGPLVGYLAAVLADDSPAVAKLVDDLVTDAEGYLQEGVDAGMLQPSADPRSRAVVLTLWNLGALVLHQHLERLLGVDLTDPQLGSNPDIAAYALPVYEIYGEGVMSEAFAANLQQVFRQGPEANEPADGSQDPGSKGTP
jgi:AcrR family transcriptional regulator